MVNVIPEKSEKIIEYAENLKINTRYSSNNLDNDIKIGIIIYLFYEKEATFSKMVTDLKLDSNTLTYNLRALEKARLISNYNKNLDDPGEHSYYKINKTTEVVINKILESYEPR